MVDVLNCDSMIVQVLVDIADFHFYYQQKLSKVQYLLNSNNFEFLMIEENLQ